MSDWSHCYFVSYTCPAGSGRLRIFLTRPLDTWAAVKDIEDFISDQDGVVSPVCLLNWIPLTDSPPASPPSTHTSELVGWECMFCGKRHVAPPEMTCDCTPPVPGSLVGIDSIVSTTSPPSTHTSDGSPESTVEGGEQTQ